MENKITKNGQNLNIGDRVSVKVLPWEPAREGTVWENQNGTSDKDVRIQFADRYDNIATHSLSLVEKI